MLKETVDVVKQAELNAGKIEKEAVKQGELIVLKAKEEGSLRVATVSSEASLVVLNNMANARKEGDAMMMVAISNAEVEIKHLQEMAKTREQVAIEFVLTQII